MTIDEKIEQNIALQSKKFYPVGIGENFHDKNLWPRIYLKLELLKASNFVKSEMLADMQKLADALAFYADESSWSISETYKQFNRIDDQDLEYKPGCGRYDLLAGKKARQALAEFNTKYKKGEK